VFGLLASTPTRPRPSENDQTQLRRRLGREKNPVQRNGFIIGIRIALERGVDRHNVVDAIDLEPVTGEVDDGNVGATCLVGEIAQRPAHFHVFQVAARHDHLK